MPEHFAQWSIHLYGSPCCACGRPAETLWVLTGSRVVAHASGVLCRLPNPQPAVDPAAAAPPRRSSAA